MSRAGLRMLASQVWLAVERLTTVAMLLASLAILASVLSFALTGRASATPEPSDATAIRELPQDQTLTTTLSRMVKGHASAKLALIEFADFQCPFCARYASGTHGSIDREFVDTGKVKYSFRHMPIEQIHPFAFKAAEAAECAGEQGRYWDMYDELFANPTKLAPQDLFAHARTIGLSDKKFALCLDGTVTTERVREDLAEAERLGITSTPTFLLGRLSPDGTVKVMRIITGAYPPAVFKTAIEGLSEGSF